MAEVVWSSWLKIMVPDVGKLALPVLTVNVPLRLARQEPEANVMVLAGVALYWKSRVAPLLIWRTAELAIAFALFTKSRPLFTVIVPIVLALVGARMRSLPPLVSPPPPLIVPVTVIVGPAIVITPPPVLSVMAREVD